MRPTSLFINPSRCNQPKPWAFKTSHYLTLLALAFLVFAPTVAAALPCDGAQPLGLDRSAFGTVSTISPVRFAIAVTEPGILVLEARSLNPLAAVTLRVVDPKRDHSALALPSISGRQVRRFEAPGVLCAEVDIVPSAINGSAKGRIRLDAWTVSRSAARAFDKPLMELKTTDTVPEEEEPPHEPLDEWDEMIGGNNQQRVGFYKTTGTEPDPEEEEPPHEPLDEWDEVRSYGRRTNEWRELTGYGFIEIQGNFESAWINVYPACPWLEQPRLLSTLTCARSVRVVRSGEQIIDRLHPESTEALAIQWMTAGRLWLDTPGVLFDAQGLPIVTLEAGEEATLAAGSFFVMAMAQPDADTLRLMVDLD